MMIVWKLGVKLSVAIIIQGKNISRKLCIHKNILRTLYQWNIFCRKFSEYGMYYYATYMHMDEFLRTKLL